ncbi:hypothetical protein ACFJIX_26675 [Roseateles sp. UC29_93]|uniref:hypothetical protein n=1 Tax=Roseateles sp. UC29_93 TaxID=3350177 RepID=UPI003672AED5
MLLLQSRPGVEFQQHQHAVVAVPLRTGGLAFEVVHQLRLVGGGDPRRRLATRQPAPPQGSPPGPGAPVRVLSHAAHLRRR